MSTLEEFQLPRMEEITSTGLRSTSHLLLIFGTIVSFPANIKVWENASMATYVLACNSDIMEETESGFCGELRVFITIRLSVLLNIWVSPSLYTSSLLMGNNPQPHPIIVQLSKISRWCNVGLKQLRHLADQGRGLWVMCNRFKEIRYAYCIFAHLKFTIQYF
jgi:hypothetical protein